MIFQKKNGNGQQLSGRRSLKIQSESRLLLESKSKTDKNTKVMNWTIKAYGG